MAALLVTCGVAVAAGSAFADSESGSGSGSDSGGVLSALTGGSDESDSGGSDSGGSGEEGSDNGSSDNGSSDHGSSDGQARDAQDNGDRGGDQGNQDGQDNGRGDRNNGDQGGQDNGDQGGRNNGDQGGQNNGDQGGQNNGQNNGQQQNADPKGRDQIAPAGRNDFVDINSVADNGGNLGDGGRFNRGAYTVDCGVSDHNNSDNYMAAPGKDNGAQHVHDYVGNQSTNANSNDDSLGQAGTSCVNGDQSTFFWPVLRDLNGQGNDVGQDGGSLDGNVGQVLKPRSAQLTFHGHGDEPVRPMPTHLMMIMGNAKQGQQNGDNVNAKYTCTGHENQVTDKYPICGQGSQLIRLLDYPSCWDGQNLESANFRDHMAFPDDQGNCSNGFVPIPALRIKLTYDQPAGRAFSIDSFPQEQHDPKTDHSDFENIATEAQNRSGADCINNSQQCTNIPRGGS